MRGVLSILFALVLAVPATAGPLEDGLEAYKKGEWDKVVQLLTPLAQQGNPAAQEKLGRLYDRGKGVKRDYETAARWYRQAAEKGDARAAARLAFMLRLGIGGKRDLAEALKWYRSSAEAGASLGQAGLGFMYLEGAAALKRDPAEAAKWFQKAADQGDAQARLSLGTLYENGDGMKKDLVRAYVWYALGAFDDGEYGPEVFDRAKAGRDRVAQHLTAAEIAEANKLISQTPPPRK